MCTYVRQLVRDIVNENHRMQTLVEVAFISVVEVRNQHSSMIRIWILFTYHCICTEWEKKKKSVTAALPHVDAHP